MAKKDLIREAVQAAQPGSGVNLTTGVAEIGATGQAIGGVIQAGQSFASAEETRKRKENAEMADADMVAYTAFMSEKSANYNLALAETSNPTEIEKITAEYEGDVDKYINDPLNMRNGLSRKAANRNYSKNKPSIFTNPAKLRINQINRRDSMAKYEGAIVDLKLQPLTDDKKFKSQLTDIYRRLESMGVYTRAESNTLIDRDMKQKEVDKSKLITAGFQNDVNEEARYAADKIGQFETDKMMPEPEKLKNISGVLKDYDANVLAEHDNYRKKINKGNLNDVQKRYFLKQIDTNLSYHRASLGNLRTILKNETIKMQNANENKLRVWEINNPGKFIPIDQLQAAAAAGQIGQTYFEEKAKQTTSRINAGVKASKSVEAQAEQNKKDMLTFDKVVAGSRGITPDTETKDPERIRQVNEIADDIDNDDMRKRAYKTISNKTDNFNEQFEGMWSDTEKQFNVVLGLFDETDVEGEFFDRELNAGDRAIIAYNVKEEARGLFDQGKPEAARKVITDFMSTESDSDEREATAQKYLSSIRTFSQRINKRAHLSKDPNEDYQINRKTGERRRVNKKTGEIKLDILKKN